MPGSGRNHGGRPSEPLALVEESKALLGSLIRERLRASSLRQSDLARKLGVPASQVHVWINRPSKLSLEAVVRILWALEARLRVSVESHPAREPSDRALSD
jgi:transcriptional regulator with XRE-family HTH domain